MSQHQDDTIASPPPPEATEISASQGAERSGSRLPGDDTVLEVWPEPYPGEEPPDLRVRFTGRATHLKQLKQLFRRSLEQHTLTLVTAVGEPGAGKTRLAIEFAQSVRAAIPEARVLFGETSTSPTSYAPIIRLFAQRFGIGHAEHPDDAREKITAAVAEVMPERLQTDVAHLIAHLMNYPFPESPVVEPLAEMPGQLEMRTYIAVRRFLEKDAERGPLLLCFDRVERARPETVNLIHYLAAGLQSCPVLILASVRPTVYRTHPHWGQGDFPQVHLEVGPLSADEAQELFSELTRVKEPPDVLLQVVRSRLRRIPRAIYELTRWLLEASVLVRSEGCWHFDEEKLQDITPPRTHEEILKARIRNLPQNERRVLEHAAVVGEVFWLDAVIALGRASRLSAGDPDGPDLDEIAAKGDSARTAVTRAINNLYARGLFITSHDSTIAGEKEYRFAYPPIWDLAYEQLDDETKRRQHRIAAQWLELRPEGRAETQQEMVGYHLQRAGDGRGAASRYRRAGDAARARYFNHKAIRLYKRALSCMEDSDIAVRIHIWHDLSSVYQLKGEFDNALDAVERMVRLSWVIASRPKAAVAFNKMGRLWRQKGNLDLALEYLQRGLEMFRESNDLRGVATSLDDVGQVYRLLGRYDEALDRSATALEMRRQANDKRSMAVSLSNIGNIEKDRGLFDEAEACYREALDLRREVADRYGYVVSLNNLGALAFERGELEVARDQWKEALIEAETIGALPLQVILLNNLGENACHLGKLSEARQQLQRARTLAREIEDQRSFIEVLRNLSMVELHEGQPDEAQGHAEECLRFAEKAQLPEMVGKAYMALGEVCAATLFDASTPIATENEAERHFIKATEVFREMGNEAELGRALKRLGEYQVERGDQQKARQTLQEAAEIFERIGMPEAATIQSIIASI